MEYLITAYPSTPTPAMILTPPARAYSPSPSPPPAPEPEQEPIASTSKLPSTSRRVLDHILLPRLPAGWLSAPPAARASEPVQDAKACHQCRNLKNPHPRFRCGRAGCLRAFCSSCLARRYGWTPQDVHARGCPDCRGVCNCSRCLDRAGLSKHKAFLTADARAGGCARKWLEERGLLVEGAAPPPKKNVARRPKILSKPGEGKKAKTALDVAPKKKVKKMQARPAYDDDDYDDDDQDEPRSRGRWIIDASTKLVRRWARERAVRGAQVRAGTRRWFVGASPPPRSRARDDAAAGAPPVETIDLTLDDDDDAPDSLFDAKSDAQPARDDKTEDDDAPDSLFDEKTQDEDAPERQDAAASAQPDDKDDDKDDAPASAQLDTPAPAQKDAPPSAQNDAPDDKDDDADSLFDGDPGTPAAPSPQIAPAPIELPSTPPQLPSATTLLQLPPTPTPIHLPSTPIHLAITSSQLPSAPTPLQLPSTPAPIQLPSTLVHLPPPPTPIQLPPASPIISLSRSDSYTDALRIDVELAMPSSPAKGAVDVHITFGDAFGGAASAAPVASCAPGIVGSAPSASPVASRSPGTVTVDPAPSAYPAPTATSPVTDNAPPPPPKSPPKTFSKAASAMFIPRAKPVAKRKRDEDVDETRLTEAKSSAGVLVALGRPGRKRVREDEPPVRNDDDVVISDVGARDGVPIEEDDASNDKGDAPMEENSPVAQQGDALLQKHDASDQKDNAPAKTVRTGDVPAHKRPREDDTSTQDDARPAKRPTLSKETARKPRADSPEREDDYDVDDEPRTAPSKETARKPRAGAGITHSSRAHDNEDLPALDDDEPPIERAAPSKETARKPPRASFSRHEDSTIVDGLPTPKPTVTKQDAARPSAADALAQAMRAAYGGAAASTSNPTPAASSAPVASSSSAPAASSSSARGPASNTKRSKPTVLAQRASLAIALKTPAPPAPSAASALAAAYKQAYAAARAPSPASTLRSSPTPEPPAPTIEQDGDGKAGKPALHDELSNFIGRFDDNDKDDEEPTPELLPSDLAAQSEGSSRTGPVSPVVAHRRPPIVIDEDDDDEEEMPARRPFVPCNPRRFVGMPLRFVPAPKRPRPPVKRVERAVIDFDTEDDDYKDDDDEDEQDFGLARRRKRTKLWEQSALVLQQQEAIVVLDDSDDSDFQPAPAPAIKGKGKSKSFGPGKGKGKTKPPPRKLPLSSFIAYSYTPPPPPTEPEPETMPEPVFVPDDDTAAAPPASEVWLGAAMAPLSPDLGLTRAVADAWFSAV